MRKIILFSLFFIAATAFAKNHWIYFGAGGEPETKKETHFDQAFITNIPTFSDLKKDYQISIAYNGGHSESEKLVASLPKDLDIREGFTQKTYDQILDDLEKKLSSKPPAIGEGEKILITIDTHGSPAKSGVLTHDVSLSGPNTVFNLDRLKRIADLAKDNKVLLGIIDTSCYSGLSLKLANDFTCVISGGEPNRISYADFFRFYSKGLKSGKSLEQIYLEARKQIISPTFPMISTSVGNLVHDDLKIMFPFLSSTDSYDTLFQEFLEEGASTNFITEDFMCRRQSKIGSALKGIEVLTKKLQSQFKLSIPPEILKRLKGNMEKFRDAQRKYEHDFNRVHLETKSVPVKFEIDGRNYTLTNQRIITWDLEAAQKQFSEEIRKTNDVQRVKTLSASLVLLEEIKKYKAQIIKAPIYAEYIKARNDLAVDEAVSHANAAEINKDLAQIYDLYYKKMSEQVTDQPNPCAQFVL